MSLHAACAYLRQRHLNLVADHPYMFLLTVRAYLG